MSGDPQKQIPVRFDDVPFVLSMNAERKMSSKHWFSSAMSKADHQSIWCTSARQKRRPWSRRLVSRMKSHAIELLRSSSNKTWSHVPTIHQHWRMDAEVLVEALLPVSIDLVRVGQLRMDDGSVAVDSTFSRSSRRLDHRLDRISIISKKF